MKIRAFQGLRPKVELAHKVASLPYDVVNTEEARELAKDNPLSMLHVVRAEIDFPEGTAMYSDPVYAKAAENFQQLQDEGALVREDGPALYIYEQVMGEHRQRGIAALCFVRDYENNLIKKHEKTRPDKENDRTRLTSELSANPGPVFLTYRDQPDIDQQVEEITHQVPLIDFTAPDSVQHRVWKISNPQPFIDAFGPVPAFYVADGHHRSASAARVGKERAANNSNHTGDEDYNAFLSVLFPASQLKILPYNRLIDDLNGHSKEAFLNAVAKVATVTANGSAQPEKTGDVSMYIDGEWYLLSFPASADLDPVSRLDVSLLQNNVLDPLLGVDDPRTSERVSFVGGIRGTKALSQAVDSGKSAVAFSLYPVTVEQLMDISDAGQIMPPKSTWFEPKLRSGLFIHTFETRGDLS